MIKRVVIISKTEYMLNDSVKYKGINQINEIIV